MKNEFVGRIEERGLLRKCLDSNRSEFVAVYGRRRVGKTSLIREQLEPNFAFYVTGMLDGNLVEQIRNFNEKIAEYGGTDIAPAEDWQGAFSNLKKLLEKKSDSIKAAKKVVFIDEISWIATMHSGFLAALDYFWNSFASARRDILLIVCGSATSWIVDNIINGTGGLHNRLTRQILLQPFTLRECEMYYQASGIPMTRFQMAESYMVFGGIPYYLSLMEPMFSLAQNIDGIYFRDGAELRNEYENLYRSLFKHADNYIKVVGALAKKNSGLMRAEIAKASGIADGGGLSKILSDLVNCGFVRAYRAFGKKRRGHIYQLVDSFTLFHLRFNDRREAYTDNYWLSTSTTPAHSAWSGLAFERVCLMHVPQIKQKIGISGVATEVSSWRGNAGGKGAQIDLVLDRADNIINLCEAKYTSNRLTIDKRLDNNLRNRRSIFLDQTKTKKIAVSTLITTFEPTDNAYKRAIGQIVTLDDLFA